MVLAIMEHIQTACEMSGCVTVGKALDGLPGDSWTRLACIELLQELGRVRVRELGGARQDDVIYMGRR